MIITMEQTEHVFYPSHGLSLSVVSNVNLNCQIVEVRIRSLQPVSNLVNYVKIVIFLDTLISCPLPHVLLFNTAIS